MTTATTKGLLLLSAAIAGFSLAAGRSEPRPSHPPAPPSQAFFKPPEVASVQNALYPPDAMSDGVVVLDVSLTETGQAAEVGAVRDIPPLTSAAATAVQSWKFKPAYQGDMALPSAITVAFVYRPPVLIWKPPAFSPAIPNPASSTNAVLPAGIDSVAYADYPVNSVASGAVILELSLDTGGKITGTKILRSMGALNNFALAAAKDWKFQPAQFQGDAVKSNVVVVFVFSRPVLNP